MFHRSAHRRRLFTLGLLATTIFAAQPTFAAQPATDVLYTRKGEEYVGRLQSVRGGKVVFLHETRGLMTFDAKDVQRVELGKSRAGDQWKTAADIDDPVLLAALKAAHHAKAFPDAGYVTLYQETVATLNPDGSARTTQRTIQKIFKERGKREANKALYYFTDNSTASIDFGRTVAADGKVFPLSDSAIQDGRVFTQYPEYQNLNRKQAALKEVKPGAVIDYKTTVVKRRTDLLHPFFVHALFGDNEPIIKKVVRVIAPRDRAIVFETARFDHVKSEVADLPDGRKQYTWTVTNTPQLVRENYMPETADIWPRLALAPKAEWADLARAYAHKLEPLSRVGKPLAAQVAALTRDCANAEARAHAIYRYLVKEIRTIPVPFYAHSLTPHDVNAVFDKKYGNNLDKTLLASAMLRAAGIEADLCLVRPQSRGALMKAAPSIAQFSDCLVRTRLNGETRFCRVVDEKAPMNTLAGDCQDVWALVVDAERAGLVKTPLAPADRESSIRRFDVTIEPNGAFDVRQTTRLFGQGAVQARGLKALKDAERQRYFQEQVAGISPKSELVSYRLSNLDDLSQPVEVQLHYRLFDYAVRAGDKLMVFHLPGLRYSARAVGKPTRVHPLDWTTRAYSANHYAFHLPQGLKVRHVISDVKIEHAILTYRATCRREGNTITFDDELRREQTAAPASDYAQYKAAVEATAKLAKEWIVVER